MSTTAYDPAQVRTWGARNAHDPTVVRGADGHWYMFSTDAGAGAAESAAPAGVHMRRSADLITWEFTGTALAGVPAEAAAWSGAGGLWAPEVVRWPAAGGETRWHMYYSASTFGSNTSAIGLATAPGPAGPWTHQGLVVATRAGTDAQNAIDAAVTFDAGGRPWLTYGSFFAGIHTLQLSLADGMPESPGDKGVLIARRDASVEGSVEGACVLHRPDTGQYILFASYGSLFSTYNIRVAVADSITGPYRDALGSSLTDAALPPWRAGTKVLGSWQFKGGPAWTAPGHNSVLVEEGPAGPEFFMVHHVRFAETAADPAIEHTAQLRRMFFTADGWPVVSPHTFHGAGSEILPAPEAVAGRWRAVQFRPETEQPARDVAGTITVASGPAAIAGEPVQCRLVLAVDGGPAGCGGTGGTGSGSGSGAGVELDAVVFGSWDDTRGETLLSFSGIDSDGTAWFGSKGGNHV